MKQTVLAALFAAMLVMTSPAAFGQEHGAAPAATAEHEAASTERSEGQHEAPMPNEMLWKWANFALLAVGLGYLIGKNAPAFFRSRTEEIQKGIAEATRTREEAEARAAEIERRVNSLQSEVAQMRTQSRDEIAREGERVRLETEASLRKIQAQSQAEVASAAKHAMHDLKAYSAKLALESAEGQIRSRMTQQAQDQLTGAFIDELRQKAVKN